MPNLRPYQGTGPLTGWNPLQGVQDWLAARRAQATREGAPVDGTATDGATGAGAAGPTDLGTPDVGPAAAPPGGTPALGAPDLYDTTYPYAATTTDTLERYYNRLKKYENDIHELTKQRDATGKKAGDVNYDDIQKQIDAQQKGWDSLLQAIAQEENRRADNARADKTAAQAQKDKGDAQAKNGDTRTTLQSYTDPQTGATVKATVQEVYNNGQWSYVPGSAKREEGILGQGAARAGSVVTDGRGAYWLVDTTTGQAQAINGPAAAVKTLSDPDGSIWTQNADGTKGQRLFESLPGTYTTQDGRILGYDKRTGQQVFSLDTQTAEGRALADRLQKATVESAELANQPKFGSATAQYAQEAQRRQQLAQTELKRLQDLQKAGQISPDQAEAQFDQWMQTNVEGPLAGYKAAAEEERRTQEQANLDRTTAEQNRVDASNQQRQQLAYQAGEAGRQQAIELGQQTRAPEYIQGLGQVANAMATGQPFKGFDPGVFDVANYRKVVPDTNALAEAAVNRLLSRVAPATARNVNVPLPPLPTGPDLSAIMSGVKYSGPLSGTPAGEQPLPGQAAIDLGNGRARTVYSNDRYIDWDINPALPAPA